MAKRRDLHDMLDVLLTGEPAETVQASPAHPPQALTGLPSNEGAKRRERLSVALEADLVDQARDVAFWTPGVTLTDLVAAGLRAEIARRAAERGGTFPRRTAELRPGAPIRG